MVPERFAAAVKMAENRAENSEQLATTADHEQGQISSAPVKDVRARANAETAANLNGVGGGGHQPVRASSKAARPDRGRNRLEIITGSIVLVLAAIIGIALRRKPPRGAR